MRDIRARSGTQTNCGGFAKILADVEPAATFEFVNADDGGWAAAGDDELINECVAAVRRGVIEELTRVGLGELPKVRFVLRRILVHPVDSVDFRNEDAGRIAAREAFRRLIHPH